MSRAKIFIDGAAGTTGLEIRERLAPRAELEVLVLSDAELHTVLADAYAGKALVSVAGLAEAAEMTLLDAEILSGTNLLRLFLFANEAAGQARIVAALDNLGKGAGGAAVQNMNLMLGLPETSGLRD